MDIAFLSEILILIKFNITNIPYIFFANFTGHKKAPIGGTVTH